MRCSTIVLGIMFCTPNIQRISFRFIGSLNFNQDAISEHRNICQENNPKRKSSYSHNLQYIGKLTRKQHTKLTFSCCLLLFPMLSQMGSTQFSGTTHLSFYCPSTRISDIPFRCVHLFIMHVHSIIY